MNTAIVHLMFVPEAESMSKAASMPRRLIGKRTKKARGLILYDFSSYKVAAAHTVAVD